MEESTFLGIAEQYRNRLFAIAFHYCKNRADADDIVQTVLFKLFKADKPFENEEHIRNWLIRVTINECKRLLLSPWQKRTAPLEDYAAITFSEPGESDLFLAVMALQPKYRIVVHLYYYEEYSTKEIAKLLEISETAVQTRLMRARKKLKQALQEAWYDEK